MPFAFSGTCLLLSGLPWILFQPLSQEKVKQVRYDKMIDRCEDSQKIDKGAEHFFLTKFGIFSDFFSFPVCIGFASFWDETDFLPCSLYGISKARARLSFLRGMVLYFAVWCLAFENVLVFNFLLAGSLGMCRILVKTKMSRKVASGWLPEFFFTK